MNRSDRLEAEAAGCTEFWYARKLIWLNTRKALEKHAIEKQPPLGSYFAAPERDWTLTRLFAKGDNPDLVFYRRRPPGAPPAQVLGIDAPEWQQLIPPLPARLHRSNGVVQAIWHIPAELKGRLARFEFDAASPQVEALTIRLRFHSAAKRALPDYLLKPYLYAGGGKEFFALPIPADADTCHLQFKLSKGAKEVFFTGFRAVVEPAGNQ